MERKQPENPRIQRTHAMLLAALTELLHEKTFDEVRVKDICQRAGLHRSTFYAHFEDKTHLLLFGVQELMEELFSFHSGKNSAFYSRFQRNLYRTLKYFQRNKPVFIRLLSDPKNASARQLFQQEFTRLLKERLKDLHPDLSPREADLIVRFFTGGLLSLVAQWLTETPDRPAREVAEEITPLMFHCLFTAFRLEPPRTWE